MVRPEARVTAAIRLTESLIASAGVGAIARNGRKDTEGCGPADASAAADNLPTDGTYQMGQLTIGSASAS